MIAAAVAGIGLHVVDLLTFLWVMGRIGPTFASVELMPVGSIYAAHGAAGAVVFKAGALVLILTAAAVQKRRRRAVVIGALVVAGIVGAGSNLIAAAQLGML